MTLRQCIDAIRRNQHTEVQKHVLFRESKLTHLLQFFFCGGGRVSMVVNINQSVTSFHSTQSVFRFCAQAANRARGCSRPSTGPAREGGGETRATPEKEAPEEVDG
ncbi:kinesin-like protein KIF23 [Solea solea]|uniref:kinesin-like protein KIF23 n=1 Tax=Solea solea TaxID=90069 RepID=UPI00272A8F33|nr:kinesin-like protein KIF23 [Solea solea]